MTSQPIHPFIPWGSTPILKVESSEATIVFPGARLFELRATHGLPLDIAINEIMVVKGLRIDWPGFIAQARNNQRWDFQIYDLIETGLQDAGVEKSAATEILKRTKLWMLENPHAGSL